MPIRWGIVSAAKICNDFLNAFTSYQGPKSDMQIVGIAARDKSRAAAYAQTFNIPKVFDTYQALAESKDIDVVYIGSLTVDHYALSKMFLEHGKHVVCEKAMCLNYKQTKSLVDLATKKKLFLMEAIWSRFMPSYAALENEIKSGKLGDVQMVEANFGILAADKERFKTKTMGGGAMLDIGVYALQLAQFVFKDEPTKVTATGELNSDGVDVVDSIILEYSGGRRAILNVTGKIPLWNKATVYGTKGRATLEDPFHCPAEMVHVDGKVEKFPLNPSNLPYNFVNSAYLIHEALEATRCIKAGLLESPRMTLNDSLILAKLEDAVRKQVGVHYDADDLEYP